jgi:EAL domain-containing protein (putative c-di-GMP-specific phosphodiesterase class I)
MVLGVEAPVRWEHPTLGLLAPAEFISLAEETGDIDAIGCWVLDTATCQVAGWRQTIDQCADLWVSVNLSAFQLANPASLAAIQRILANPSVEADKVMVEVTETALAAAIDGGIAALHTLKGFGVRIAIDDFGTGFSSLSSLARLPVDILKIDRSFVSGHTTVLPPVAMLEGILGLADKLNLDVIAEGIEQSDQLELRSLGCTMGQGYLLARPAPAHGLEAQLTSGPHVRRSRGNLSVPQATAFQCAPSARTTRSRRRLVADEPRRMSRGRPDQARRPAQVGLLFEERDEGE